MKQLIRLTRFYFQSHYGVGNLRKLKKFSAKAFWKNVGIGAAMVVAVGEFLAMYVVMLDAIYPMYVGLGQPGAIVALGLVAACLMTLFFGLIQLIGLLYYARDNSFLLSLPLKPWQIFCSRFLAAYLWELLLALFFLVPPLCFYIAGGPADLMLILRAVLVLLLAPVLPLAIGALLSLCLMRVVSFFKRREGMATLLVYALLILLLLALTLAPALIAAQPGFAANLFTRANGIIEMTTRAYPPAAWATEGLLGDAMKLLLFVAATALITFLLLALSTRLYFRSLQSLSEVSRRRRTKAPRGFGVQSAAFALFVKEWRMVLRTPAYALNGLFGIVMGPLMLIILMVQGAATGVDILSEMIGALPQRDAMIPVILILACFMSYIGALNTAASTVLSREGKQCWLIRIIPVPEEKIIDAKFLFGYSISAAACLTTGIAALFVGLPSAWIAAGTLLALLACFPLTAMSMIFDLYAPRFNWLNPTEAIKQNPSSIFAMLACMAFLAALILLSIFLMRFSSALALGADAAVLIFSGWLLYGRMRRVGLKKLPE